MRDTGSCAQTELGFLKGSPTSLMAAEQVEEEGTATAGRARLLAAYEKAGSRGLTDDEARTAARLHYNAVRFRRRELVRALQVVDSTFRRRTKARKWATVYRIATWVR